MIRSYHNNNVQEVVVRFIKCRSCDAGRWKRECKGQTHTAPRSTVILQILNFVQFSNSQHISFVLPSSKFRNVVLLKIVLDVVLSFLGH